MLAYKNKKNKKLGRKTCIRVWFESFNLYINNITHTHSHKIVIREIVFMYVLSLKTEKVIKWIIIRSIFLRVYKNIELQFGK